MVDEGLKVHFGYLDRGAQEALLADLRAIVRVAPFYLPAMPRSGRPFSIEMTNAGPLGWVSDKDGYRYQATHPMTGDPWPAIPQTVLDLWRGVADYPHDPQCCLINLYRGDKARLGLHRDEDEETFEAPVVSVSLGDTCVFRIGGPERRGKTRSFRLASGDVLVLGGPARLHYHGVDRVLPGSSTLLDGGGRINLTLRRVTPPGA
jgi:alkylated DNA repair protein (DNA oxidative demethylase)